MKFYSGFSLKNDKHFFQDYIQDTEYTVAGFSYGAILAFEYVKEQIKNSQRIDRLQLFSPAFFQTKSSKFKRLQTISFRKDRDLYLSSFIKSCFRPHSLKELEHKEVTLQELEYLLNYEWSISQLLELTQKGVKIEVYLGNEDKVVDTKNAKDFFVSVATITSIKDANHFLEV